MTEVQPKGDGVRPATLADAEAIAGIYNHFVTDTTVTFDETPVTAAAKASGIEQAITAGLPYLVVERAERVVGYAAASRWKGRCGYRFSVECAIYVNVDHTGQGLGSLLYQHLLALLRQQNEHVAIGGIALPNDASVALHEKFGFRQAAHFREVGYKFGRWIDVGYWQLILSSQRHP